MSMFRKKAKSNRNVSEQPHVAVTSAAPEAASARLSRSASVPPTRRSTTPSRRVAQSNSNEKLPSTPDTAAASSSPSPTKSKTTTSATTTQNKPPKVVVVNKNTANPGNTSPVSTKSVSKPTTPPPSQPPPPPPAFSKKKNGNADDTTSNEDLMFQTLLGQAQVGDVASQFWLGQMYQFGGVDNETAVSVDLDLAMAWMTKKQATTKGAIPSDNLTILKNYQMGIAWEYGTNHDSTSTGGGEARNLENAVHCYERAFAAAAHQQQYSSHSGNASNGNNQMDMAALVQDALERAQTKLRQCQHQQLKDAADKEGEAEAQYQLGLYYWNSENTPDKKKAVEYWELAANQDHGLAQCRLGECYEMGVSADQNRSNTNTDDNTFDDGDHVIVPRDLQEAFIMYEWSVEGKCIEAHFKLGWFYEDGRGGAGVGPGDYDQALELYEKAFVLAKEQQDKTPSSPQEEYKETVKKYVQALLRIGAIYEKGNTFDIDDSTHSNEDDRANQLIVQPDLGKAISLYEKAATIAPPPPAGEGHHDEDEKDDEDNYDMDVNGARDFYIQALVRIGLFYEKGTGQGGVQEPNYEKALEFYHMAAATTMTEGTMVEATMTLDDGEQAASSSSSIKDTKDLYLEAITRIGTSFYEANASVIDHHFIMALGLYEQSEATAATSEMGDYEEKKTRHVFVIYEIGCFYEQQAQQEDKAMELYEQAGTLGSNEARSAMKRIKMQRRKQELLSKKRSKASRQDAKEDSSTQQEVLENKPSETEKDEEDTTAVITADGEDIDENPIYADPTENADAGEEEDGIVVDG